MNDINRSIGQQIRFFRRRRGITLDELSARIGKSKATLSKYETGTIDISISALVDIASALDTSVHKLIKVNDPSANAPALDPESYFNRTTYFAYFYDGRIKELSQARIDLSSGEGKEIKATAYLGVKDFENTSSCQHIFEGRFRSYDMTTYITLSNTINPSERLYICLLNPTHPNEPAVGIMTGISTYKFFAPASFKIIVSRQPVADSSTLLSNVQITKQDMHQLKLNNMLIIDNSDINLE